MESKNALPQKEEELIPFILEIVPSFKKRWEEHLGGWEGEPAGIYNDIAEFAHFVVDSYDEGNTFWYKDFFGFVERMIIEGNEKMQELAVIGFLETIQTISSWKPHKGKVFKRWLGTNSKKSWKEIDKVWSKYRSLANVIRAGASVMPKNRANSK